MADEERIVGGCNNFKEFQDWELEDKPNCSFGDGVCPGYSHIISGETPCAPRCEKYESVSGDARFMASVIS